MAVKVGEIEAKLVADIKKSEDVGMHLRAGMSDRIQMARFRPAQDLKKGDTLRITVEKV